MKKGLFALIKSKSKGNTLIELIIVMGMVALVGGSLLNLISTGGNSFKRISDGFKAENEARIAMSYVTVKIRQNDISGGIKVLPADGVNFPERLQIEKPSPAAGNWEIYGKTVDGIKQLLEDDGNINTPPAVIAENIEFYVNMTADKRIQMTIRYLDSKELIETITLRTD